MVRSKTSNFNFKDKETGWNNPNKTKEQKELLKFRGKLLNKRMNYSLGLKIKLAKRRIRAAIRDYGKNKSYISFSGGKDSTVLSHLVLSMGYNIDHVYSNTRLEYPSCIKFAKDWCKKNNINLEMILPEKRPYEVWKEHGYPMFSKEISSIFERLRKHKKVNSKKIKKVKGFLERMGYEGNMEDLEEIRKFLKDNKIRLSSKCCKYLKKKPLKKWQKNSNKKVAIMGMRAEESQTRRMVWVRKGCIYETKDQVVVHPIIFFTDEDIWNYIDKHDIKLADIYYNGLERNGCYWCGFGSHVAEENNFQKLKKLNPSLYKNVMNHWGFEKICKKCNVDH